MATSAHPILEIHKYTDPILPRVSRSSISAPIRAESIDGPGAFGAGDTPVPIPNTTVKTRCGDDTPMGESSTVPDYTKTCLYGRFLVLWKQSRIPAMLSSD